MNNELIIPENEIEITASRAGGPGGQHVNKTNSRITLRWNARSTTALTELEKERVLQKLQSQLTTDGDLIIHHSSSRSQLQNKEQAIAQLHTIIQKALIVPKKRKPTKISKSAKTSRLETKARHGVIKKMRSKKFSDD